jgi:hypothetical protein
MRYSGLPDLSFFFEAQIQAAEQRGQPLQDAFSFSGRTAQSVQRLALQHRRVALVDAAAAAGADSGSPLYAGQLDEDEAFWALLVGGLSLWADPFVSSRWRNLPSTWLAWDDECDRMATRFNKRFVRQLRSSGLPELQWPATVDLEQPGLRAVEGIWRMKELLTLHDIHAEGQAQSNCLLDAPYGVYDATCSYWSLRFIPALESMHTRSVKSLRLTVSISESQEVEEVQGPCNADPHPAADKALVWWARRCAVKLPSYYDENDRNNEEQAARRVED